MHVTFVATRKNRDRSERELYEMDYVLRVLGLKRAFVDLGLLTIAGATPAGIRTTIVDEYAEEIDYDIETDLVALSAKTSCAPHAYHVADEFRRRGKKVVMGGIHASLRPEEALEHADCIVTGEADALWPDVVRDFERGQLQQRYDVHGFPPMDRIPAPRWPAGSGGRYLFHQIQTTRGCPFQCRFCSVPDISGQAFRFKPVENVLKEIKALPKRGASPLVPRRPLYIVDDNFLSRAKYTKELLEAMGPIHRSEGIPPWSAETTLNVAQDEALLDLFQAAGCSTLILGIESISQATLEAMDKGINFCMTYPEAIERIHTRGMSVVGNFIVGFDTDTLATFKDTRDFIQDTGIVFPFFSILTPMPGTALHDEYKDAGRLDHLDWSRYDTRHVVFEPTHMRRDQLMDGYIWLNEETYATDRLLDRLERHWKRPRARRVRWSERAFLAARLTATLPHLDGPLRRLFQDGIKLLLHRHLAADPGNLLVAFDSTMNALFLRRFRSAQWAENTATFQNPTRAEAALQAPQWENEKAKRRTERLTHL